MTVLQRIEALRAAVQELKTAKERSRESTQLKNRLQQANDVAGSLAEQIERMERFRKEKIQLKEAPKSAKAALSRLEKVRTRFAASLKVEELTRGKDWEVMRVETKNSTQYLSQTLAESWKRYIVGSYSGDTPKDLRASLAPTDHNLNALTRYERAYEELNAKARRIPVGLEDFAAVRKLATELREISQEFRFDVPEAVSQFLKAIASGGAELSLLTDEVVEWLKNNDSYGRYHIVTNKR